MGKMCESIMGKKLETGINPFEIIKGMGVEREHGDNPSVQLKISMDHLQENPRYYDYLEIIERAMDQGITPEELNSQIFG